ncbi:MAG: class I SAM-dependent methyltransferase [Dehalococcoidia bacterium]
MSAVELWKSRVKAHHAQSIKAQGGTVPPEDFWRPFASHFWLDPYRKDDPVLNRLIQEVQPEGTVLDVGGGAGRFALPLALRCRHVTVVEPSQSMVELLRQEALEADMQNLSIVQGAWEGVELQPAEVVLCAHVLYGVEEVEPFVRKLDSHARDRVLILMFVDSPQSHLSPLWKRVHGEERVTLPGLRELLPVLWEMELYPSLEMVHTSGPQMYETWEGAREEFRRRLYVKPGTAKDRRLETAMEKLLDRTPDGLVIRGTPSRHLGLLLWRPK